MNERLAEIISEVVAKNYEELAFMFAEQADLDDVLPLEEDAEAVQMTFTGHFAGVVVMAVPQSVTLELAANMLGMDEDSDEVLEATHDSLKEMLNVICGHILTDVAGTEVVFDLSVPDVSRMNLEQWRSLLKQPDTIAFELDDQPLLFNARMKTDIDALLAAKED